MPSGKLTALPRLIVILVSGGQKEKKSTSLFSEISEEPYMYVLPEFHVYFDKKSI